METTPITFYDIAMRPPVEQNAGAPNPWKSRYALNFKRVPYSTKWVPLADIPQVRRSLGVPACRKFADGSDYCTLPMITDPTTNSSVGDSFEIAVYLQQTYPNSGGDLFPPQMLDFVYATDLATFAPLSQCNESSHSEYARFNTNVDAALSAHVRLLVDGLRFDPATAEANKAEFVRRAGVSSWDDLLVHGEEREKLKASLRDTLTGLAKLYKRDSSGPFILGKQPSYADFVVGGWLQMLNKTLPEKEWEEVCSWHDSIFGELHDALQQFAQMK